MKLNVIRPIHIVVYVGICIATIAVFWKTGVVRRVATTVYSYIPFEIPGVPSCPDCNVVIVALDVLRADDMPCYGYSRDTTPNICAFAKKNSYFTRFYSESSYTMDTMFSILTGLLPTGHKMLTPMQDLLNPGVQILPQILKRYGYTTIYGGNTDDPNLPLDRGLGRGIDEIFTLDSRTPGVWPEQYQKILPKLQNSGPVFMLLHSYALHDPYLPGYGNRLYVPGSYDMIPLNENEFHASTLPFYKYVIDKYTLRVASGGTPESKERNQRILSSLQQAIAANDLSQARKIIQSLYHYEQFELNASWYLGSINREDQKEIAYLRGLYDERLTMLDSDIKPLLDFVSRPDIKRRTIFIIVSPHGEEFMEHGQLLHDFNIYNSSTYVPLIISAPKIQSDAYASLGQGVDIFSTVLDMLGIKSAYPVDGISLKPILTGISNMTRSYIISEHRADTIQSIFDGTWKLYVNVEMKTNKTWMELYNIISDPGEKFNIVAAHLDESVRLERILKDLLYKSTKFDSITTDFPNWLDELKRKKLIESGYF